MTKSLFAHERRYLALFLPWLPAERLMSRGEAPADQSFALIEKQRGALRIVALNPEAARLGLEPGQALADARGRLPDLAAFPHDPLADAALLTRLARICGDYTPSVQCDPPQGLLLDVTGCAHLHGGEAQMRDHLVARVAAEGLTVHTGLAKTPQGARALARFGGSDLSALPLAALDCEAETLHALTRAGFRRLGDLSRVSRKALAARFGMATTTRLARLLGEEDAHIVPEQARERVFAEARFAEPIGRTDDVLDVIEHLLERTAVTLRERGEGGRAFRARLHRSDGHVARLAVETGAPTRDPALVLRLLRERIDGLADPLDPGFGYDAIDLLIVHAEALPDRQVGLEAERKRPDDLGPLLDRLAVRHGPERVLRFVACNSHTPERAGTLRGLRDDRETTPWPEGQEDEPPLRPLVLLDPPQRVRVTNALPEGPPRQFSWRGKAHSVLRHEGPERLAAEWWHRRDGYQGNPGLTRDYYRVEDEAGHRFWLFRHGLYGLEVEHPDWYIHGLFA
ncbi:Y-family DNA polymerase [Novosphingobium sp. JCM 18896]|uniref:Y-family DNA polymerase n=1 Tax=Novosphingobium sp. JCM 18896 TaxID=2989731 RepID=UPI0022230D07|nr:DNA polymerase Y family protein [Novosphingobium sp. JCM 18896]MCW1428766.1 DNA polymerase Y family protein [Novosphingobium sp. JCM 18896]